MHLDSVVNYVQVRVNIILNLDNNLYSYFRVVVNIHVRECVDNDLALPVTTVFAHCDMISVKLPRSKKPDNQLPSGLLQPFSMLRGS